MAAMVMSDQELSPYDRLRILCVHLSDQGYENCETPPRKLIKFIDGQRGAEFTMELIEDTVGKRITVTAIHREQGTGISDCAYIEKLHPEWITHGDQEPPKPEGFRWDDFKT